MRKKISLVIVSNSGAPVKQFTTSKALIRFLGFFLVAGFFFFSLVIYDYLKLKKTTVQLQKREAKVITQVDDQEDEIRNQRIQIQDFANEITSLKEKLVALNKFESKIRIIANLDQPADTSSLFGVGGSIPEDLDAQLPLSSKHNSLMREMHEQVEQLHLAVNNQEDGFDTLLKSLEDQQNLLASTPTIRPIDPRQESWITSRFGYRQSPFTGRREFHKGYDISTREGTPILATAAGTVTYVGRKGFLGKVVIIDHGHGMVTRFGHCQEILKKKGEKVKRWEPIATVGNTGRSTGPHVHYEVMINGLPVNPEKFMLN